MLSKLRNLLSSNVGILFLFILIDLIFFWKFFFLGLIPIPGDIVIGSYFPWLNEKWGYAVGVPVKNALMSDIVSLLYPWRHTAIGLIKSGQLPLWDPSSFMGNTLIGNFQAGIFNPFNLLFFLPLGFNKVWGLQVVIQPLIAMVTMYFLLKNWKLGKMASVFGALSYAFSAQVLVWIEYNLHSFILGVFPLFILAIDKCLEFRKKYWLILISLLTAYIIFVGYPQHLYYFTSFGFLYLAGRLFLKRNYKEIFTYGSLYAFFIFLGLLLSAISLLPGVEALSLSVKNFDNTATTNAVLFLPWQNLITGFAPDFFGNPATNNYFGLGYYESFIFYTSLVTLPFALIALGNFKPLARVLLAFLFVTFILALKNPVSEITQNVAWLGLKGSVSSRILFIYGFSLSGLAALGFDSFLSKKEHRRNNLPYLPGAIILGIFVGIGYSFLLIKYGAPDLGLISTEIGNLKIMVKNLVIPSLIILAVLLILFISRFLKTKFFLGLILIGILLLDTYRFSAKYLPFTSEDKIFPETPVIKFLESQNKPFRIGIERGELMPANTWSVYGLESVSGYNIILPKESADFLNFSNMGRLPEGYSRVMDTTQLSSKFLDAANLKYMLVLLRTSGTPDIQGNIPFNLYKEKYEEVFKEGPVAVFLNQDYLERLFTVQKIIGTRSKNESYQIMASTGFDFKTGAIVEKGKSNENLADCELSNLNYKSQEMEINAECPHESFLVVSEPFDPGWKASINNKETEIFKTNGMFFGINLPPGISNVKIQYSPDSFRYGIYISLFAATVLLSISLTTLILRRRNGT